MGVRRGGAAARGCNCTPWNNYERSKITCLFRHKTLFCTFPPPGKISEDALEHKPLNIQVEISISREILNGETEE